MLKLALFARDGEMVDTIGLGPIASNGVEVQLLSRALFNLTSKDKGVEYARLNYE